MWSLETIALITLAVLVSGLIGTTIYLFIKTDNDSGLYKGSGTVPDATVATLGGSLRFAGADAATNITLGNDGKVSAKTMEVTNLTVNGEDVQKTTAKGSSVFFTASWQLFKVPGGVTSLSITGIGGGGGGAAGGGGGGDAGGSPGAGGGGGSSGVAAVAKTETISVTPGELLTVQVGAAGTGGAASGGGHLGLGPDGNAGSAGGDTTITSPTAGVLYTASGGLGGVGGTGGGANAGTGGPGGTVTGGNSGTAGTDGASQPGGAGGPAITTSGEPFTTNYGHAGAGGKGGNGAADGASSVAGGNGAGGAILITA